MLHRNVVSSMWEVARHFIAWGRRVATVDEQCSIGFQPVPDRQSMPARLFIGNNFGFSRRRRSMRFPAQAGSLFYIAKTSSRRSTSASVL
jgi:hypothetical protein